MLQPIQGNCLRPNYRAFFAFLFISICLMVLSCGTVKDTYYFKTLKKDTTIQGFVTPEMDSKIVPGDRLSIVVTSLSGEEDRIFNQGASSSTGGAGYTVNPAGNVLVHRLGEIKVSGLSRKQVVELVQASLLPYMKEPIVQVSYLNHKVTVLGEVGKPQVYNMPEEPINLVDLLVLSGDVTPKGKRDNITLIREEGNKKIVRHVNLEDHSIFTSPYYYVQPNDIIYVFPDTERFARQEKKQNLQANMALIASLASFVFIIVDRITR